ncbi:KilA-N domain-containing protein [Azotobacter beijerinckii]|uniref:KilA-N domain-containing protein n=1 Tax=Azotobacter beijerinckii TaxID=170623 RepID=A0A1I4C466_9GAMM|nr:KilA-N domain-containing protein [Azotobacter beijerinckii]SFB58248.1 KilA-N domain-containing protein [Azotobacter beijerinckii]SFK75109.1 KilA-N domain-containing protein [Azotobacter beijerinckii]
MSARIIPFDYEGQPVRFNADGWLHATEIAERFGKHLRNWLDSAETLEYVRALDELQHPDDGPSAISNVRDSGYLKTRRGNNGGTWLHPKLAVAFARWISPKFAAWCDMQIDALLRGDGKPWASARREAALGYRAVCDALALNCEARGKTPQRHHFINESRLINEVITGAFAGRDRDQLSAGELEIVTLAELRDSVLIASGMAYAERKASLSQYMHTLQGKRLAGGRAA